MSVLKSVLIVIEAGVATVLLAVAAKAGLEEAGVKADDILLLVISMVGMNIVVGLSAWRIRRIVHVPAGQPSGTIVIASILIFFVANLTVMLAVLVPLGAKENWPLSMSGLLAMGILTPFVVAARQAAKAAGQ